MICHIFYFLQKNDFLSHHVNIHITKIVFSFGFGTEHVLFQNNVVYNLKNSARHNVKKLN